MTQNYIPKNTMLPSYSSCQKRLSHGLGCKLAKVTFMKRFKIEAGTPAARYLPSVMGWEAFVTSKPVTFDENDLSPMTPANTVHGFSTAREVMFKLPPAASPYTLLAVANEHIQIEKL